MASRGITWHGVCDEAVYAKVQQIRWKENIFHDRRVVCLGEFHATICYLSVISKIFQDAGLRVSQMRILEFFTFFIRASSL